MELKALSLSDVEQVRQWRNQQTEMLRTPFLLTQEQQEKFYHDVICNRQANARYWGIWEQVDLNNPDPRITNLNYRQIYHFIGMCGIENIQWENRLGEISLVLNPEYAIDKYGEEALRLLLHEGFNNLNLENIFAEAYQCNPYLFFWDNITNKLDIEYIKLPCRKYLDGEYFDSYYINFNKEQYVKV